MKMELEIYFVDGTVFETLLDSEYDDADFHTEVNGYVVAFGKESLTYIYPNHTISSVKVRKLK